MRKIDDEYLYENLPEIELAYLKQLPENEEINHEFSPEFEQKMKDLMSGKNKALKNKVFPWPRVAAVILVFLLVIGTAFSVEASRAAIFSFIETITSSFIEMEVHQETPITAQESADIRHLPTPNWIPDQYTEYERNVEDGFLEIVYRNEKNAEILYSVSPTTDEVRLLDNEKVESKALKIHENSAKLIMKNGTRFLLWRDEMNTYELSGMIDENQLVHMAESISKK